MIPFLFPFSRGLLFPLVALDKIYFFFLILGRKRSGSPRDRLDYRGDRMGPPERSLSHGRDPSIGQRAGSSSRNRDPRIDDRMRRISPEQMPRERYRLDRKQTLFLKQWLFDFRLLSEREIVQKY